MQDIKKKFWLEKFDCFSITGKDARKFLNGITTGNILNSENKVIKTCWLTPNGVLRSLIEIIFLERSLEVIILAGNTNEIICLLYTSPSPRDKRQSRMPSSA